MVGVVVWVVATRPIAARLPSPWDPLLVSPWEGDGDGSRERGRLLCFGGVAVMALGVVVV